MPRHPSERAARGFAAALAALVLGGCTAAGPGALATSDAPPLDWRTVTLPAGLDPRTLTTLGDRLLVGALRAGDPPAPAMVLVDDQGRSTAVPVTSASPYGAEARWYSVATDGTRVIAIGGANGGAHANVRWTTWSGTAAGVAELPQSFYTFGGWGAGDLVDAAITPSGDALVGSWGGAQAGLDTSVWTFADPTWTRQDSAGTALASTAEVLTGPRGATVDGSGLLIAGSALHLTTTGTGGIRQTAAVWRSSGVATGWRRLDLPDAGAHSEAVSAHCPPPGSVCVVAGQVDGSLALWRVDGERTERVGGIPTLAVGDQDPIPAPLGPAAAAVVVSPSGGGTVVLSGATAWAASPGPSGRPTAAAVVGSRLYVATQAAPGGPSTLWFARWPG